MEVSLTSICNLTSHRRIQNNNQSSFSCYSTLARTPKRIKVGSFCGLDPFSARKIQPCVVVRCSSAQENCLRPKPRPRPKPAVEVVAPGSNSDDARSANLRHSGSGLCDQIEKLVFFKRYEEALELFEIVRSRGSLVAVAASTYDSLVTACIGLGSGGAAKLVFRHMIKTGFEYDQYIWNRVLRMYFKCGMPAHARRLFNDMPDRNKVTWNTMIAGLVEARFYDEAFDLFVLMWGQEWDANPRLFATIIRAAASLGFILAGRQLHSLVLKVRYNENVFISCALIDMYSKCGCIEEAQRVFDEMPEKTVVGWNTIIAGYALHGYSEKALDMSYRMRSTDAQVDHYTYSVIFSICARLGSLEHAKQAHACLIRDGFGLDLVANSALVDLYSKWGRMEDARNVFEKMPHKNLVSWNSLIGGYGNYGMGIEAIKMYERMLKEGMIPDHITFLAVLRACSYSGLLDKGKEIFEMMSRNPKKKTRAMHYACLIELFGREGLLDEAYALINNSPFSPTRNMWAALLTACRIQNNLKLGEFAAEKLVGLGSAKLGNYIVLLNIYNSSGRVDEAAKILEALKRRGIRLHQACSWIEIKKQPHQFIFGDKSHPQSPEIYEKLHAVMDEIVELGYVPDRKSLLPDVAEQEQKMLTYHSEKLAIAFGLISTPDFTTLQILQSHRICSDCHIVIKLLTLITKRVIVVRDASRFHRFRCGSCSCSDYW